MASGVPPSASEVRSVGMEPYMSRTWPLHVSFKQAALARRCRLEKVRSDRANTGEGFTHWAKPCEGYHVNMQQRRHNNPCH